PPRRSRSPPRKTRRTNPPPRATNRRSHPRKPPQRRASPGSRPTNRPPQPAKTPSSRTDPRFPRTIVALSRSPREPDTATAPRRNSPSHRGRRRPPGPNQWWPRRVRPRPAPDIARRWTNANTPAAGRTRVPPGWLPLTRDDPRFRDPSLVAADG